MHFANMGAIFYFPFACERLEEFAPSSKRIRLNKKSKIPMKKLTKMICVVICSAYYIKTK